MAPGSERPRAHAASASGKLAPQNSGAGTIAHVARAKSSWKLNQTLDASVVLIGQNGSEASSISADHAIPTAAPSCAQASARRGDAVRRATTAPAALPSPRPIRNTATMIENV